MTSGPFDASYVYAGDRPTVMVDPSGMRGKVAGVGNPVLEWNTADVPQVEVGGRGYSIGASGAGVAPSLYGRSVRRSNDVLTVSVERVDETKEGAKFEIGAIASFGMQFIIQSTVIDWHGTRVAKSEPKSGHTDTADKNNPRDLGHPNGYHPWANHVTTGFLKRPSTLRVNVVQP